MNKTFRITLEMALALLIASCGSKQPQAQPDAAGSTAVDSTAAVVDEQKDSEAVTTADRRQNYHFEYQLVKDDDSDQYGTIIVRGHEAGDNSRVFECRHELVDLVSEDNASDVNWLNDSVDINFDGIPDLQIFLMYYTRGQVAEKYAAYVWTSKGQFEEVKQWEDLCNPQIHPEDQTITENYRSDINERTYNTYKWSGDTLQLINTRKGKFFGE